MAPTVDSARRATRAWAGCRRWWFRTWASPSRPPIIEPIVAAQQAIAAHDLEREVAREGCRSLEVIDAAVAARVALRARGAAPAQPLVEAQAHRGIFRMAREAAGEHRRILDRHGAALREERQHRVRGVAQQGDRADAPGVRQRPVVERPALPRLR